MPGRFTPCFLAVGIAIGALVPVEHAGTVRADNIVEVPILATIRANDRGLFNVIVMNWDKAPSPHPLHLTWGNSRVSMQEIGWHSVKSALRYAATRLSMSPAGTLSLYGASYVPIGSDGASAGAVLAVGFMAVLRGDPLLRGIALNGHARAGRAHRICRRHSG